VALVGASSAKSSADHKLKVARKALAKAKKAVRKAVHNFLAAHGAAAEIKATRALVIAKAKHARAKAKLGRAEGAAAVAAQRFTDAQAATAVASAQLTDAQDDLTACRAE
jgi:hypothetical protein